LSEERSGDKVSRQSSSTGEGVGGVVPVDVDAGVVANRTQFHQRGEWRV
jgi:hypothetical protein